MPVNPIPARHDSQQQNEIRPISQRFEPPGRPRRPAHPRKSRRAKNKRRRKTGTQTAEPKASHAVRSHPQGDKRGDRQYRDDEQAKTHASSF